MSKIYASTIGNDLILATTQSEARGVLNLNGNVVLTNFNTSVGPSSASLVNGRAIFQDIPSIGGRISKFRAEFPVSGFTYPAICRMLVLRNNISNDFTVLESHDLTVPSSGIHEFTDADFGTVQVDAGDFVGFFGPSSGGVPPRYSSAGTYARYQYIGDPGTSQRTYTKTSSSYQVQYGWTIETVGGSTDPTVTTALGQLSDRCTSLETRASALELKGTGNTVLLDKDFRVNSTGWTKTAGWTDSSGFLSPTGAGDHAQQAFLTGTIFQTERRTASYYFAPVATGISVACGHVGRDALSLNEVNLVGVDDVTHTLTLFNVGMLGTEPTANVAVTIASLVAGRTYRIDIIRDRRVNSAVLVDTVTGATLGVVSQGDNTTAGTNTVTGNCNGAPLLINKTGVTRWLRVTESTPYGNRPVYMIGDSRTTGHGLTLTERWSQKVYDAIGTNVVISAMSGMKSDTIGLKLAAEIPALKPSLIICDLGTNDQDGNLVALQTEFGNLKTWCAANDCKLAFAIIPPNGRTVTAINAYIRTLTDVTLIQQDLALSLNNDGVTQQSSLYQGGTGVHENAAGNMIMYTRAIFDLKGRVATSSNQ